jgi:hypothetical protein
MRVRILVGLLFNTSLSDQASRCDVAIRRESGIRNLACATFTLDYIKEIMIFVLKISIKISCFNSIIYNCRKNSFFNIRKWVYGDIANKGESIESWSSIFTVPKRIIVDYMIEPNIIRTSLDKESFFIFEQTRRVCGLINFWMKVIFNGYIESQHIREIFLLNKSEGF